jgi:hypothetical protein
MAICGIELTGTQWAAIGSFAFAIASEVIGRSKLKENSVIDVAMHLLGSKVKSLTPAHTPKASERITPSRQSEASPAPRRRGRPAKKAPSSKT